MHHGRAAGPSDQIDHPGRLLEEALRVGAVGAQIRDARQALERGSGPATR